VRAKAIVTANPLARRGAVHVQAPAVDLDADLSDLPEDHPIAAAVHGTIHTLRIDHLPACNLHITSTIPVASGLGSGAAVSVAIIRAVSTFVGKPLGDEETSAIAFEVEKIHHGTPSGIDNSVVTFAKPVYYRQGEPIQPLKVPRSFTLVIANTGIPSPTRVTVGDVRRLWEADPAGTEAIFAEIQALVVEARRHIESGNPEEISALMSANQDHLRKLGVSSVELDRLVESALQAGALGAKLSGGGRGGNIIALVRQADASGVDTALLQAGAVQTIITRVGG
jgi:mevalonate kinase